jgi:hypothetical protein
MEIKVLYLLAHFFIGFLSGFMGIYVNLEAHKKNFLPYFLVLAIIYSVYITVILGLARFIGWVDKHILISQAYIGLSTILMLLSVYPGILFAKKILRKP